MSSPKSCDTFVVLPDKSKGQAVVFGKNSDRPQGEVQEVIHFSAADHGSEKLQCTYIEIPQVAHTHAVILSKPSWMWGAEMGANSLGVCVGNEAVWTNAMDGSEKEERLLGMDLVRLSLERSSSASEAVDVITSLLEAHGQGGPCSDSDDKMVYHNSFLIADHKEAWILETADKLWVAKQIKEGYANISNCLSIGTSFDKSSENIKEVAKEKGFWDGAGDFDFAKCLGASSSDCSRKNAGEKLLAKATEEGSFDLRSMMAILRDTESGICRPETDAFHTSASMVSLLPPASAGPASHWLTGTPNPCRSVFKPFVFTEGAKGSPHTVSPSFEDDPAKATPRFARKVDRSHLLYKRHQAGEFKDALKALEDQCIEETLPHLQSLAGESLAEVSDLFKDCVDSELKFYSK